MQSDIAIITLVLVVVIGSAATDMFKHYMQAKRKKGDDNIDSLKAQNEQLTQRIQVLEKLVTDDNYELKQQLNRL